MTTYFILLPGDTKESLMYESNILGEDSFNTFYPSQGFDSLYTIINTRPELLEEITILDHTGAKYTVDEFLTKINTLRFKRK